MLRIAASWEAYAEANRQYNAAGAWFIPAGGFPRDEHPVTLRYTLGVDELTSILVPKYIKSNEFPRVDGWGHEWRFAIDAPFQRGAGPPAVIYAIRSAGRNGTFDDPILEGKLSSFDDDLVYSNARWINRY